MPTEPQVEALFATPLFTFTIDDAENLNEQLLGEIRDIRAQPAANSVQRSNRSGGWHSESDLFRRTEPGMDALRKQIVACLSEVVEATTTAEVAQQFDIGLACEGWINVNPRGGFNSPHVHSGNVWSGTYYVQVPVPEGRSPGGAIEFIDPRTNANASNKIASFQAKRTVRPLPGTLIIFPSYLLHWVLPNECDADRVTIAFNANLIPRPRASRAAAVGPGQSERAEPV